MNNKNKIVKMQQPKSKHIKEQPFNEFLETLSSHINELETDHLTESPERAQLLNQINQSIKQADESRQMFGLLLLDLNRFKIMDENLNHQCGEEVIRIVSARLRSIMRKSDIFLRLENDEFIIIANNIRHKDDLVTISHKLLKCLKESISLFGHKLSLKSSIGISIYPQDADHVDSLLATADLAMYQSKELGDNHYQFYSKEISKKM